MLVSIRWPLFCRCRDWGFRLVVASSTGGKLASEQGAVELVLGLDWYSSVYLCATSPLRSLHCSLCRAASEFGAGGRQGQRKRKGRIGLDRLRMHVGTGGQCSQSVLTVLFGVGTLRIVGRDPQAPDEVGREEGGALVNRCKR